MLCRVLLTIVVLTYLLCLLLISGLQKEDFNENVVRKLQRHNVNIDDIANLNLTETCKNFSITLFPDNTERSPDITESKETNIFKENSTKLLKDDTVDMETNNQRMNEDIPSLLKASSKTGTEYFEQNKDENQPLELNKQKEELNVSKKNDYSKLDNFMNLWKSYSSNSNILDKQLDLISKIMTTPKPVTNNYFMSDPDAVRVAIDEIVHSLSQRKKSLTTESLRDHIGKQVGIIIAHDNKSIKEVESKQDDAKRNVVIDLGIDSVNKQYNVNRPREIKDKSVVYGHDQNKLDQQKDELKNRALNYLNNMLQLNPASNVKVIRSNEHPLNYKTVERNIPPQPNAFQAPINDMKIQEVNYLYTRLGKNDKINQIISTTTTTASIPQDSLKQIVDKVRKLILDDLKKNIVTITPSTTMIITTEKSTAAPVNTPARVVDVTNALNNFIKLLQKLQIKEEKIITELEAKKMIIKTEPVKITTDTSYSFLRNTPAPSLNPYKGMPYQLPYHMPLQNYPQTNSFKTRGKPITIQTNSNEVKPLNIRISKSSAFIHQNIVVTTTTNPRNPLLSLKVYKNNYHSNFDMNRMHRSSREITTEKNHGYRSYESERTHYDPSYNDRGRDTNFDEQYRSRNHRTRYAESLRDDNIKGYHEKLEKADIIDKDSKDDDKNCCKANVWGRQQVPLSFAKKLHDEVRFKNFLKTQQKVNDMLEKILSGRNMDNDSNGVEVP